MKRKIGGLCVIFVFFSLVMGCVTTPIENQYPERWEKTKIGMSLEEFRQVWPEARYGGLFNQDDTKEVWTFTQLGFAFVPSKTEYFTFQDNKLVKFRGD
jgi:hypothetical protein